MMVRCPASEGRLLRMKNDEASIIQAKFYKLTAAIYDQQHMDGHDPEHEMALYFLTLLIDQFGIRSALGIRADTARTIEFLKAKHPRSKVMDIEPVAELRARGTERGVHRKS